MSESPNELVLRGVRGSVPTTDAAQRRHGGNTSCLELPLGAAHRLIIDCGTGLRSVDALERSPEQDGGSRFDVLLTHFHWDHLLGLPFFRSLYDPRNRFHFYGAGWNRHSLQTLLEDAIRPPWVPVGLRDTPSQKTYHELDDAPLALGGLTVRHARLFHPQGVTAFRLERAGRSVVFATDTERGDAESDAKLRDLSAGADVLIHDAQYTPEEYDARYRGWGHSTWRHAVEAAADAGVARLILFHHDPERSDDALDAIVKQATEEFPEVEAAREGLRVRI